MRVNFDTLILNLFFDFYIRRVTNAPTVLLILFSSLLFFYSKRDDDAKSDKDDKATMMMIMNIVDKVISVNLHLLINAFMFMLTILMLSCNNDTRWHAITLYGKLVLRAMFLSSFSVIVYSCVIPTIEHHKHGADATNEWKVENVHIIVEWEIQFWGKKLMSAFGFRLNFYGPKCT